MPTKYDTNPLDEDFPQMLKAQAEAEMATQGLSQAETRHFAPLAPTEDQTRRLGEELPSYPRPSAYAAPFMRVAYQPVSMTDVDRSSERKVERIGLPEYVLTAVPYIPWYIGMVAGLLLLLLMPRSEAKIRFHAAQGLAAHLGILVVSTILSIVAGVAGPAAIGEYFFNLITQIVLVVFAIKAWKGKPVHIESLDRLTNWLDEKVSPKLAGK